MNSSLSVANYFIDKSISEGRNDLTPMKLIKLVYIAHGWHLAINNEVLIDENAEAWRYGPVIPSVYNKFKHFKNNNISMKCSDNTAINDVSIPLLDKVWDVYKNYSGVQLSAKTHEVGTPWYITWYSVKNAEYMSLQIPDNLIRDHYKSKLEFNKANA
ncbi:MAG: DUF4065 domain-containing protein [Chitinophagales bacterium]